MGLDDFSNTNLIIDGVAREYSSFINYSIDDDIIEFHLDLGKQVERKNIEYLISSEKTILKKVESNNYPKNLYDWELDARNKLSKRLEQLDLNMMEFAKSKNLDLFLNILVESENYIEYAGNFLKLLKKTNRDNWINEILKIAKKTKANIKRWSEFDSFQYDDIDRSDVSNLKLILRLGRDFYKNLYTKLLIVLERSSNDKKISDKEVLDSLGVVLDSFITKEKTIIEVLTRIKDTYDDKVEDVNIKSLLNKIIKDNEIKNTKESFLLISKLNIIDMYIRQFPKPETVRSKIIISEPSQHLNYHAFQLKDIDYKDYDAITNRKKCIIEVLTKLKSHHFIDQNQNYKNFRGLFDQKIDFNKIAWYRSNAALNYFIKIIFEESVVDVSEKYQIAILKFKNKDDQDYRLDQISKAKLKEVSNSDLIILDEITEIFKKYKD